jgi:hypothetical protein
MVALLSGRSWGVDSHGTLSFASAGQLLPASILRTDDGNPLVLEAVHLVGRCRIGAEAIAAWHRRIVTGWEAALTAA